MNAITLKRRGSRISSSDRRFDVIITMIVTLYVLTILYPLIYVVSSSFSSGTAVTEGKVLLWPVDFSLQGYKMVFNYKAVWLGYANTLFYTIGKTMVSLFYTTLVAYVLSRKTFQARKLFTTLCIIPMWFSGGLIPSYILISGLGLNNSRWGYLLMTSMNVTYMIIMRTYFQTAIPGELLESAKIDGVSDIQYLLKIALPLAKPVMSVITLYLIVAEWNNYMGPMIYLRPTNLHPLQLILRRILEASQMDATMVSDADMANQMAQVGDVLKYGLIVVSTVPMLCLFPFVQKFFNKGLMMGALKG
ncbi:MAG: carbohydrate ABC transporter permease [Oscillospiraceae bacterium]|nr:carbohydrate ABC transporter permease [Oscillospiraceae bacterium]